MPKGKADRIDLSHLSVEDAVKQAWEAEPPPENGEKKPSEEAEDEQERQVKSGQETPG